MSPLITMLRKTCPGNPQKIASNCSSLKDERRTLQAGEFNIRSVFSRLSLRSTCIPCSCTFAIDLETRPLSKSMTFALISIVEKVTRYRLFIQTKLVKDTTPLSYFCMQYTTYKTYHRKLCCPTFCVEILIQDRRCHLVDDTSVLGEVMRRL